MRKIALIAGFLISCVAVAQEDTVVRHYDLPAVAYTEVRARINQNGTRTDIPDSTIARLYPAGTLTDLFGNGGMLNLKSYGPGGLATTSIRGANAMQTPVIWNGLNLQNITNNHADLSLLPTFLFDATAIQPGSSSAGWGSGTIGGAIQLRSYPGHRDPSGKFLAGKYMKQKAAIEFGSFGAMMGGYQVAGSNGWWTYDLKLFRQLAQNNYWYNNIAAIGSPREMLAHAATRQQGFMSEISYLDSAFKNQFGLIVWVQESRREIPETMLSSSESVQQDYACRILANWNWWPAKKWTVNTRAALVHEGLLFDQGYSFPLSNTDMWSVSAGSDVRYAMRYSLFLTGGINTIYSSAEVTEFVPYTTQLRSTAFISFGQYLRRDDEWNISVRAEAIDGNLIEPVGSAWYYFQLKKWIGFRACVSHNYRVPTFNDLYWFPGGNPDLKAETSWTEELTTELKPRWKTGSISYAVTVYNRNITNMISWVPLAAYWSPQNIAEVQSRGVEHRFTLKQKAAQWSFTLLLNADYIRSTYEKTDDPNDVAIGKQLIYVPAWFGGGSFTAEWKDFFVTYVHNYTDLRFTTRDHLEWLPSYNIASAAIGWSPITKFLNGNCRVDLFLRCNNIFDQQYESIAWRPMPGRSFMIGCTIDFARQFNK